MSFRLNSHTWKGTKPNKIAVPAHWREKGASINHALTGIRAIGRILYWHHVGVGDCAFHAMIERAVVEDIMIDGKRRVTAKEHRCVESYVLTKPSESDRKMMEADYKRHLARLKETAPGSLPTSASLSRPARRRRVRHRDDAPRPRMKSPMPTASASA